MAITNEELYRILDYKFKKIELIEHAFSHSSAHPKDPLKSNERLEFLGDSVLKSFSSEYLFFKFPTATPKQLTAYRKRLESTTPLARIVDEYGLVERLKTAPKQVVSEKMKADLFEALIGAVYLDGGTDIAKAVLSKLLSELFDTVTVDDDYISQLKEWGEKNKILIEYLQKSAVENEGHTVYDYELYIDGKKVATAEAENIQKAQWACAKEAWGKIKK